MSRKINTIKIYDRIFLGIVAVIIVGAAWFLFIKDDDKQISRPVEVEQVTPMEAPEPQVVPEVEVEVSQISHEPKRAEFNQMMRLLYSDNAEDNARGLEIADEKYGSGLAEKGLELERERLWYTSFAQTSMPQYQRDGLEDFFVALQHVEIGDYYSPRNPGFYDVHGDAGEYGPLQITEAYLIDSGLPFTHEDVGYIHNARLVCMFYWDRYCPEALKERDFETLARIHNGGPRGMEKDATVAYWNKVQEHLKQGN